MKLALLRLALLCLLACSAFAQPTTILLQQPDCQISFTFANTGNVVQLDNGFIGCVNWTLTYSSTGFLLLLLQVESAPDAMNTPGVWVAFAGTVNTGVNPNTATTQASTTLTGFYRWIRVKLVGAGPTGGTLTGTLYGWRAK